MFVVRFVIVFVDVAVLTVGACCIIGVDAYDMLLCCCFACWEVVVRKCVTVVYVL